MKNKPNLVTELIRQIRIFYDNKIDVKISTKSDKILKY